MPIEQTVLNRILAPVVMFVYNRPVHTARALESLKTNKIASQTHLYIFADGPKPGASAEEVEKINETRELIRKTEGFMKLTLVEQEKNQGLARSVISGVSEVVTRHGKVIVLEDDLLVSPYFLDFMNEGLELYQDDPKVYSVNGYMFPIPYKGKESVLLPYTSTWGWATWKNKWEAFDEKMPGKELLLKDKKLVRRFDLGTNQYSSMLDFKNNSWGIKWYYSVFMRGGLNLFPARSLVTNIGFDGSGTNCHDVSEPQAQAPNNRVKAEYLEKMDEGFHRRYIRYFTPAKAPAIIKKTLSYFRK